MPKPSDASQPLAGQPVYLAAKAINSVLQALPAGTAYVLGIVLSTMWTGQLVHQQGSLARAALPYVLQLRWGRHRVERALERGKGGLEVRFDQAFTWCLECLPGEPVRVGRERRTGHAIGTSTGVRLRATKQRCARLGTGSCQRAQRAVQANIVAALTTVALIRGSRVGVVRRPRCGATCQEAGAHGFAGLPPSPAQRLFSGDAGMATVEPFQAAPAHDALVGRLRKTVTRRRAPAPKRPGNRGRPALHGPVRHPGAKRPEGRAGEDTTLRIEAREVRGRRWRDRHSREAPQTPSAVGRVDDPADKRPLLTGTTARELPTEAIRSAYAHRWPVETPSYGAQGPGAMGRPRAWSAPGVERRLRLAVLAGSRLKASAAACDPLPMGPGDVQAGAAAGRSATHLALPTAHSVPLALKGFAPRTYRKISDPKDTTELPLPLAA